MEATFKNHITSTMTVQEHIVYGVFFELFLCWKDCEASIQLSSHFWSNMLIIFYHNPMQCSSISFGQHAYTSPLMSVRCCFSSIPVFSNNLGYCDCWYENNFLYLLKEASTILGQIISLRWNSVSCDMIHWQFHIALFWRQISPWWELCTVTFWLILSLSVYHKMFNPLLFITKIPLIIIRIIPWQALIMVFCSVTYTHRFISH